MHPAVAACLAACATGSSSPLLRASQALALVEELPHAPLIILGEEHDAPAHHQLERQAIEHLSSQGRMGALLLEMVERGHTTVGLSPQASEVQVRERLAWNDKGWPWADYGPVVMSAVRASVPVIGANLPRSQHQQVMQVATWDRHLPKSQRADLLERIDSSHCGLLPRSQLPAMARIQVARDAAMAREAMAVVGVDASSKDPAHTDTRKSVVLVVGGEHARRDRGVPSHLPSSVAAAAHVVMMVSRSTDLPPTGNLQQADQIWRTPELSRNDPCNEMKKAFARPR